MPGIMSDAAARKRVVVSKTRAAAPGLAMAVLATTFFSTMVLSTAVRADGPAGDACAGGLTPDGKAIYAAVVAAGATSETLKSVTEHETRSLAMGGKIGRGKARDNAVAAGECMKARLK